MPTEVLALGIDPVRFTAAAIAEIELREGLRASCARPLINAWQLLRRSDIAEGLAYGGADPLELLLTLGLESLIVGCERQLATQ